MRFISKHLLGLCEELFRSVVIGHVVFRFAAVRYSAVGIIVVGLAWCSGEITSVSAQTVSSVSPLVSSGSYTVSSSPLPNGGRVQTVYYPPQYRQVASNTDASNAMTYEEMRRASSLTTDYPSNVSNAGYAITTTQPAFASQRPSSSSLTNDGWQSVNTTSQVVTTMYQQPMSSAPQLQSVPSNQTPTIRTSPTNVGSSDYYSRTTTNFQGGAPAANTAPTLPPNGTFPPNTVVQGSTSPSVVTPGVVTTQPQNGLNWQPINGSVTYPPGYRYTPNGVCTPVNAQYVNATSGVYRPYSTYKPLVPLRRMPGNAYLGQGLYGQPKAYVDGENVRNFFRYMLP